MKSLILWTFTFTLILTDLAFAQVLCQTAFAKLGSHKIPPKINDVMDVSRTEMARSYTFSPFNKQEIIESISLAQRQGLKVSIKGTNHSHGGHNRIREARDGSPRGLQLDMINYNRILAVDESKMLVTVEAGITWKDLAVYLNTKGLAAKTEQSSNIFSVGGSVSTNIHGRDVHGPMINSIESLKYINSQGEEQLVSRSQQPEIFRAMVGGYGGMGVITEVVLRVEKNHLFQAESTAEVSIADYVEYLKGLSQKDSSRMHYGRVNISGVNAFTKMSYVEWQAVSSDLKGRDWQGWKLDLQEKNRWISSMIMNLMRYKPSSDFGKMVKDFMDKFFGLPKTGTLKTKNNILNNPVQFLFDNFYNQKHSVDILQEYFIPVENLEPFLQNLKLVSEKYRLDLMNVTMRFVPKIGRQSDSLLSPYSAKEDQVAVVLYFNIEEAKHLQNGDLVQYDGKVWTQEIIKSAQSLGGTFYWPYHRWWNNDQISLHHAAQIREYFAVKDRQDPQRLFENDFLQALRGTMDR